MLIDLQVNWTQFVGLVAFCLAGLSAFIASIGARSRSPRLSSLWRWIGIFQLLYFSEIVWGGRHFTHDLVNLTLRTYGLYQDRTLIQAVLLAGITLSGCLIVMLLRRWFDQDRLKCKFTRAAIFCTAALLLLFSVETISLHAIDDVLYRSLGPLVLVAYLWGAGALGVVLSAFYVLRVER
jgi:hypothetical protein